MHFRPVCASPAAIACPARELAWPSAGLLLTYFAQLGLWGISPRVHNPFSSGFNVLYLFGADRASIKVWKWLWLCLWGPGSGWSLPLHSDSAAVVEGVLCPFSGAMVTDMTWNSPASYTSFASSESSAGAPKTDFNACWPRFESYL